MIRTYSSNISVAANTAIPFNTNKILTGNTISHSAGSSNIVVRTPGYYSVTLDVSGTIDTTGPVVIQLFANGIAIPDALIKTTYTANTDTDNSFTTTIKATPGAEGETVTLTVVPTAAITVNNIALGMNRLA